jgi:alpha-mannosidase
VVQPDTNLPAAETFARHFTHGQNYFRSRFGRTARVAWAADSFGHCAGLPQIMAEAGITGFAFTRPSPDALPLAKPAFWWESPNGARVMGYRPPMGWYGTERDELNKRLDDILACALKCDLQNVGIFFGLGDHGGGPTRRHTRDLRQWAAAHPQVQLVYSGLHRLFDALYAEVQLRGDHFLPTHRGEMNFTLRGCYASVAKFKFAYRKTEAALASAERTDTVIRSALNQPVTDTHAAWDALLFNTFHDILPGSSIERAYDDQLAWLGGAYHQAQGLEMGALNALAQQVDTRVDPTTDDHPTAVSVLVWNPHPWLFHGHVEWEANLDYRPIYAYRDRPDALPLRVLDAKGRALPFQVVAAENSFNPLNMPWRKRIVVPVQLPPLGWGVFQFGWVEGAVPPEGAGPAVTAKPGCIDNGLYRVQARAGAAGIHFFHHGKKLFQGAGLSALTVKDPWGSWGGADKGPATNLSEELEHWPVVAVETLEHGPERALLWVRLAGQRSHLELSICLYRGREAVEVSARLLWNERSARLKLAMPLGAKQAEYETPAARVRRTDRGEVPGGRWVRAFGSAGTFGFASDSLYCFDCDHGVLRASIARASGYAYGSVDPKNPHQPIWRPSVDSGELKFRFLIHPGDRSLPQAAQTLEQPPVAVFSPAKPGKLPRTGSLAALQPASLQLLALKRAEDGKGVILRVQETAGHATPATLQWLGQKIDLGTVKGHSIATWRLLPQPRGCKATRTSIIES